MSAFFIYLLKAGGWIAAGWLVYYFFLRNEKFYTFNRVYLMIVPAVSFLIPLVKIHYPVEVFMAHTSTSAIAGNIQTPVQRVDIYSVLFYIYIFCIVFLIIRQLFLLLKIKALIRSAGYTVVDKFRLVNSPETKITFSFFNYIFLNFRQTTEVERQLIIAHERSHIFQRHWIDLAVAEIACILLWFNPFVWFYLRSVKENHEYLADEAVIRNGFSPVCYRAALINQSFNAPVFSLVNSFSHYKFKRIAMMKKETSNPLKKLAVMLLIPAACIFLWAFSKPEYRVTTIESTVLWNDTVTINNSSINSSPFIIHGDTTVSPRIFVDGKDSSYSSVKKINPSQVESVALHVYESGDKTDSEKVKNSVVIITTKKDSQSTKDSIDNKKLEFHFSTDSGTYTTCDSPPLYIVDGKEVSTIKDIDPRQIESFAVLKDTSAVELYGEKGKNGVVMIVTKGNESTVPTLQVSGTVTDGKDGKPLSGVSILVEKMPTGTVTDMDGKYSLNVPANAILQFSYINMATKSVSAYKNNEVINVSLEAETKANDTIQASITALKNQQSGEIARPLYIIDGKEFFSLSPNALDPNQIDHIDVLKNESAVKIYGDKGKNGVVIITTKK